MKQEIRFRLFGGVSVFDQADGQWRALDSYAEKGFGKKKQEFLTYLLLNSERRITSAELIEHFWPGEGRDPANSLKNMVHKTRALLHAVFPDAGELLVTQTGGYEWNHDALVAVDVREFEELYRSARNDETQDGAELERKAFELYQGEILPGVSAEWLDYLNTYYRTVYIDICKTLARRLLEENRYEDTILVCRRGYALAPEIEEFTLYAMQAMMASGLTGQAIKHYEEYRVLLWETFGLVPSERVENMYVMVSEANRNEADFEERVMQKLTQIPEQMEAFQCGIMVFQNIVQLELRHMARGGYPSSVAIVRVETRDAAEHSPTNVRRMERTLLQGLRAGDPFARLKMGSFVVLLSGADRENSGKVMERLRKDFFNSYPRSRAVLKYSIYPLNPEVKT